MGKWRGSKPVNVIMIQVVLGAAGSNMWVPTGGSWNVGNCGVNRRVVAIVGRYGWGARRADCKV